MLIATAGARFESLDELAFNSGVADKRSFADPCPDDHAMARCVGAGSVGGRRGQEAPVAVTK